MDFFEDPEIKAKYDKCKLTVKIWEHRFIKKYKRQPSKLDIREAPIEVRHAYRKYYLLKSAALEQSFMDIEGFDDELEQASQIVNEDSQVSQPLSEDSLQGFIYSTSQNSTEENSSQNLKDDNSDLVQKLKKIHNECGKDTSEEQSEVWGLHLNHTKTEKEDKKLQNTPIASITNKLFSGLKFNKRNPRKSLGKSLSFSSKSKSNNSIESPQYFSQPDPTNNKSQSQEISSQTESIIASKTPEVTKQNNFTMQSVPINPISDLDHRFSNAIRKIDEGWLQRVAQNTGLSPDKNESNCDSYKNFVKTKIDYSSDSDVVESSDEEPSKPPPGSHIVKKLRLSFNTNKFSFSQSNQINKTINITEKSENNPVDIGSKYLNQNSNVSKVIEPENSVRDVDDQSNKTIILTQNSQNNTVDISSNSLYQNNSVSINNNAENNSTESLKVEKKNNNASNLPLSRKESTNNEVMASTPLEKHNKGDNKDIKFANLEFKLKDLKTLETKPKRKCGVKTEPINKNHGRSKANGALPAPKNARKTKTPKRKSTQDGNTISPRRSERNTKTKISMEELNSSEEDPFHSDNDEKDPEYTMESEAQGSVSFSFGEEPNTLVKQKKSSVKDKSTPKGRKITGVNFDLRAKVNRKNKDVKEEIEEEDITTHQQTYELEYSVKPRVVASRCSSIVNILKEKCNTHVKNKNIQENSGEVNNSVISNNKKSQAREQLEKKISAGKLNENFVTINLKKKVFVKGKSKFNFRKYKNNKWKAKKKALCGPEMDMSGCDGGKLTCFNCGQEGHFAMRCPNNKGDDLLPANVEEECEMMSLKEAQEMAVNSNLSIRKPKVAIEDVKANGEDNDELNGENFKENDSLDFDDEMDDILLAEAARLEEYVNKLDVNTYIDNLRVVPPYYAPENQFDTTPNEVLEALNHFGHSSFRGGQEKAIMRILQGKSTLVTLATGTGKSLCYQLPAYLYAKRGTGPSITLVISPLVSLMEDQVIGIPKFLKAACLHTNQTEINRQKIIEALESNQLDVLLISPEAIVAGEKQTGFRSLFRKLPPVAFACIDEVHCISQWSHNFRPSYLMVSRVLRESLGVKTILGLTATATRATCENIIELLGISDGLEGVIKDIPLPDNLHLTVSKDASRDRALLGLLTSEKFKELRSIIVYCTRRDECERIAAFLRTSFKEEMFEASGGQKNKRKRFSVQAEPYHAGLSGSRRRTIQNAFMSGELRIVVATVAFGMGINKSDIRAVIHFNMPNSFESYVQEVGRAGRDGLPAYCHVFLDSQGRDESELRRHIHANSIDRHVIRKLLQKVFVPCACKEKCPKHEVAFSIEQTVRALDIPEENITTLLCYLELHKNKYLEILSPAYTLCKVVSYGGLIHIKKAAKDCPPLAMALAMYHSKDEKDNILEFPVVDVASVIGWESGICKHKLKNLEWTSENNQPKRSCLSVKFSNLGLRFLAPGNLPEDQLDEALDNLYKIVVNQEEKSLKQLTAIHKTLCSVAEKSFRECISTEEKSGKEDLKKKIREYFGAEDPLANVVLETGRQLIEEKLIEDIRAMVCMYRDNQFTGRALARIFHGIQSPNYPAVIWGKCKFWRSHLQEDFHEICKIASREILKFR